MRAIVTGGLTTGKSWERDMSKLSQIFSFLTGYEIMFEESRRDIKPINRIPKVGRPGKVV